MRARPSTSFTLVRTMESATHARNSTVSFPYREAAGFDAHPFD